MGHRGVGRGQPVVQSVHDVVHLLLAARRVVRHKLQHLALCPLREVLRRRKAGSPSHYRHACADVTRTVLTCGLLSTQYQCRHLCWCMASPKSLSMALQQSVLMRGVAAPICLASAHLDAVQQRVQQRLGQQLIHSAGLQEKHASRQRHPCQCQHKPRRHMSRRAGGSSIRG